MKKMVVYKKIGGGFLLAIFMSTFLVGNTALAATEWFYLTKGSNGAAEIESKGFAKKTDCDQDYATVNSSWKETSIKGCYSGGQILLSALTSTQVRIGDSITINGINIVGVKNVLIGTTAAQFNNDTNKIVRVWVPAGSAGGKITIVTAARGTAVTSKEITIINSSDSRFWYTNAQSQIMGPDGGFTTLDACTKSHIQFNKDNNISKSTDCLSGTLAEWQNAKNAEGPLIPKVPTDQATDINAKKGAINTDGVYTLLAPIGSVKEIKTNNIGDYFNIIFKLAIGLCAGLAVIMIIISSVQYMGDESIFGKTEAKSKIISAIMGLLIALGSYALLSTINPALNGSGGLSIGQVAVEVEDQPMVANDPIPPGGAKTTKCPGGINFSVSTAGGVFPVCNSLEVKLKGMIDQAWSEGYKISGFGYRSKDKQIALRSTNCGAANIYTEGAKCTPPTAIPGTSMHESGLAFDLRCDGVSIQSTDNRCFLWLKKNASTYGLQNLNGEPWHWSTTGH
jgi:hypothetical protein